MNTDERRCWGAKCPLLRSAAKSGVSPLPPLQHTRVSSRLFVSPDAPEVALRFRVAVIESVEQLKTHPRMGTLFQSGGQEGLSFTMSLTKTSNLGSLEVSTSIRWPISSGP